MVLLATFVFADGTPTPGLGLILQGAGWIALANVVVVALSVGVGLAHRLARADADGGHRLAGDRHQHPGQRVLAGFGARRAADPGAVEPGAAATFGSSDNTVFMATGIAVAVICAWLVIPQLVGAWRTRTRDA